MAVKVNWREKAGAFFLVDESDGRIHAKVTPSGAFCTWEATLDGHWLGEFWDGDSAKAV
jgi:hypothetical protein